MRILRTTTACTTALTIRPPEEQEWTSGTGCSLSRMWGIYWYEIRDPSPLLIRSEYGSRGDDDDNIDDGDDDDNVDDGDDDGDDCVDDYVDNGDDGDDNVDDCDCGTNSNGNGDGQVVLIVTIPTLPYPTLEINASLTACQLQGLADMKDKLKVLSVPTTTALVHNLSSIHGERNREGDRGCASVRERE
jgi:hypothetical protein